MTRFLLKRICTIFFAGISTLLLPIACLSTPTLENPWTIRCEDIEVLKNESCIMYQELLLKKGGLPVLQFSIGVIPPQEDPIVLITLPLGIYLPSGVSLKIDNSEKVKFPIERCEPDGCHVLVALTEKRIEALKSGNKLEIMFHDGDKVPLVIPLSLQAFEESFSRLNTSY